MPESPTTLQRRGAEVISSQPIQSVVVLALPLVSLARRRHFLANEMPEEL